MEPLKVDIPQENITYEIKTTHDIFSAIQQSIPDHASRKFLLVTDDNVYRIYKEKIVAETWWLLTDILILSHGEENKNIENVMKILDRLMQNACTRKDYIIALWGWVVWDITWLAGALFKRWINIIQVPTTLLSMCDSSVWGKTWVDYQWVKNGIWSFFNPKLVLIDSNFLKTLHQEDILWGYLEWLKHAIMLWPKEYLAYWAFIESLENKQYENIDKTILGNIWYKLGVVASDPTETNGKRKILNYGHTFWHAIETYLNFQLGHGICVGIWILFANLLSYKLGYLDQQTYMDIEKCIHDKLDDIQIPQLDFEEIYWYMSNDKKNDTAKIKFILLNALWSVREYETDKEELKTIFDLFIADMPWKK